MNSGIVKQKATYEKICDLKTEGCLYFPREDSSGIFHCVSSGGEVFQFSDSSNEQIMSLNGMINGLCFDNNGFIYVTDLNQCAIFFKQLSTVEQSPLIENIIAKEYDGKPFKGPTSLAFNKDENVIYFCDSGNFETASMCPFDCALYSIDLETRVLKQIINKLSFISDVCYDGVNGCIYLAETFMNRILRLKQNEDGIYISSVFYQFSGRIGPSALTLDENGNLFVARFEYSTIEFEGEMEGDGIISVVNKEGIMIGELTLPELPEISGLYISPKKRENLYVTERNSTGIFRIKISSFTIDLDKYEELLNGEKKSGNIK
jgi:sugar lactone lactonase YvrE